MLVFATLKMLICFKWTLGKQQTANPEILVWGFLLTQESGKRVISRIRLSWFTCEPHHVSWGRTCWLREQDETSPLPVFDRWISSRCTVRPLTCALSTGLWRGSYTFLFVPHFTPTQISEFGHFCTFSPKLFQSTPTFFPIAMLSNPLSHLSQLSSTP